MNTPSDFFENLPTAPTSSPLHDMREFLEENNTNNGVMRLKMRQSLYSSDLRFKAFKTFSPLNYICLPDNFSSNMYIDKNDAMDFLSRPDKYMSISGLAAINNKLRFFVKINGVIANVSTPAAKFLDDWQYDVPQSGLLPDDWFEQFFAKELLHDICYGFDFWENVNTYPWSWLIFERVCYASNSNIYFLSRGYKEDVEGWSGRVAWLYKHFGSFGVKRFFITAELENMNMLCHDKHDILITTSRYHALAWSSLGGVGLYFPEIDVRYENAAKEVANRLQVLNILGHIYDPVDYSKNQKKSVETS
jgi:hypothetical protein